MTPKQEAEVAIEQALAKNLRINRYGFGYYPAGKISSAELGRGFMEAREELRGLTDEVATSISWLRLVQGTKVPRTNSYWLKKRAQEWGKANGLAPYISNGALIAAAMYLRFPVQERYGDPNAAIGVSLRSARAIGSRLAA